MSHRYELKSENKGATDQALDFPKLSLKKGEVARLAIFALVDKDGKKTLALPNPEGGYYFGIRKPNGDFAGSYECLAPEEVKNAEEYDPDACAHCKAVMEGAPEDIIESRRRRFVMPVIRYRTAPGKSTLTSPPGVECIAWTFTDRYFNALVDEHEKWADDGGLLGHDISLLCEQEQFQTYKLSVEPKSAWRENKDLANLVFGTYASGVELAPSLRRKLGQTLTQDQMQAKIAEALRVVSMSDGGVQASPADMEVISGLADEFFGDTSATEAPQSAAEAAGGADEVDLGDLAGNVPAAQESEAEATPTPDAGGEADEVDFDQFFS